MVAAHENCRPCQVRDGARGLCQSVKRSESLGWNEAQGPFRGSPPVLGAALRIAQGNA